MANLHDIQEPTQTDLLIGFCDIAGFTNISRKLDGLQLFDLLNGMAVTAIRCIKSSSGRIMKFMGDSMLLVFPEEAVDEGIRTMLEIRTQVIGYFASCNIDVGLHFGIHYGEAIIGPYGEEPYRSIDVFGESVNRAAIIAGTHKGKFVISPQAFRKLLPETRKLFHKFTPPIVYIAE